MNVIVIKRRNDKSVVAIVEQTAGMSSGAVALAWAKSNGHTNFPTDCIVEAGVQVIPLASVLRGIMPCHELEQLEADGRTI